MRKRSANDEEEVGGESQPVCQVFGIGSPCFFRYHHALCLPRRAGGVEDVGAFTI